METNKRMRRKVSFEVGSSEERREKERLRKWKGEMEKEYNKLREEWETRMKGMEGRLSAIEVKLKGIKEQLRRLESKSEESGESGGETRVRSNRWGSELSVSGKSSSLSVKEIGKLKDMMKERER